MRLGRSIIRVGSDLSGFSRGTILPRKTQLPFLRHLSDVGIWQRILPAIIEYNLRSLMESPSPLFTVDSGYEKGRDFLRFSRSGRSDAFGEVHDLKTVVEPLNGRLDFERQSAALPQGPLREAEQTGSLPKIRRAPAGDLGYPFNPATDSRLPS